MKARRIITIGLAISVVCLTINLAWALFELQIAHAEDPWQKEFESICSKTDDVSNLSTVELKDLVARSDKLKMQLQTVEEPQRKIFSIRLRLCRDLFEFMLETKVKEGK